ncbi:MAG: hypothetical protein AAF415_13030 [Pseudomonadota bacterium]
MSRKQPPSAMDALTQASFYEIAELAMQAKTKIKFGEDRAATLISVREMIAMAWMLDFYLPDHPDFAGQTQPEQGAAPSPKPEAITP